MEPKNCDCGTEMIKQEDGSYACPTCGAIKPADEVVTGEIAPTTEETI